MSAGTPAWVTVDRREISVDVEELSRKTVNRGRLKRTTVVTEITEQPFIVLSCGHRLRAIDFDAQGKNRKRLRCFACEQPPT